jgi:hypothetical protein
MNNNRRTDTLSLEDDSVLHSMSLRQRTPVYANIYHFSSCFNWLCSACGLGVYHTGIEIQ